MSTREFLMANNFLVAYLLILFLVVAGGILAGMFPPHRPPPIPRIMKNPYTPEPLKILMRRRALWDKKQDYFHKELEEDMKALVQRRYGCASSWQDHGRSTYTI